MSTRPDGNDWVVAMRQGDFARAWSIGDQILARNVASGPCWHLPRHHQWVWDGRPLRGRVLVRCYHGLGDTIQFARFLTCLERPSVWAQPALLPLLASMACEVELLPLHDGTPEVEYDVDIEIMELAHAVRVEPELLAAYVPYFDVAPAARLSERFSVGLVAESGEWNRSRSIAPALLRQLTDVPQVEAFSLQLGAPIPGATDASTEDVLTLASRLRALDLVISVDTMVAHLAGALGVRVWTLLPYEADWRWMDGGDDTPWYPSMRLLRQPAPGAWEPVVQRVSQMLRTMVS